MGGDYSKTGTAPVLCSAARIDHGMHPGWPGLSFRSEITHRFPRDSTRWLWVPAQTIESLEVVVHVYCDYFCASIFSITIADDPPRSNTLPLAVTFCPANGRSRSFCPLDGVVSAMGQ